MKVIGTAGHIDHGKSTLVERLTGIDPDRLLEEKRRGMTIDLGFAWLTLPSGIDVSLVDVPGHERFIKNMLAGAAGIDVVLLVVAADEGVMPQTREHLDIVELLGIQHGVVALAKEDVVDDEWLALVEDDVRSVLAGTGLRRSPIVAVSAVTGRGIAELVRALDMVVAAAPERNDRQLPHLPVDRVFTRTGFGTVVTGTVHDGSLLVGDEVEVLPGGLRGRIRAMQSHKRSVERVEQGDRVALNLGGIDREYIHRGDVVAPPGRIRAVRRFDARVRVLDDALIPLRHSLEVALHIGAAERAATVSTLEEDTIEPGTEGWIQIKVRDPVPVVPGQRLILRLPAPARTIAGGAVVDAIPRHRRREAAALTRLGRLASGSEREAVLAALEGTRPRRASDLAAVVGLTEARVQEVLSGAVRAREVVDIGSWYLTWSAWRELVDRVVGLLTAFHESYPLRSGMPREELRSRANLPAPAFHALLPALERSGAVRLDGPVAALHTFVSQDLDGPQAQSLLRTLQEKRFSPPTVSDLLVESGASSELLGALVRTDAVAQVSGDVVFDVQSFRELQTWTLNRIREHGSVTVAEVRDQFNTSRKFALAFLEYLDTERITRRQGDLRVLGSRANTCG